MGLLDLERAEYNLAYSPLDSNRFGLNIARASVGADSSISGHEIAADFESAGFDLAIVRFNAGHGHLAAQLTGAGAHVVLADALLYFGTSSPSELAAASEGPPLRTLGPDDWAETEPVIAATFAEYGNHYSANPLLNPPDILAGYLEWAEYHLRANDCDAFAVTADDHGSIGSVALVSRDGGTAEISLAGTHPDHQRRGLYEQLIRAVQQHYGDLGMDRLVISTQSHNVGVIRAWEKVGWRYLAGFHTVHLLSDELRTKLAAHPGD